MSFRLQRYSQFSTKDTDEFIRYISRLMDRRIDVLDHRNFGFEVHTAKLELLTVSASEVRGDSLSTRSVDAGYVLTRLEEGTMERRFNSRRSHGLGPGEGSLVMPAVAVTSTFLPPAQSNLEAVVIGMPAALLDAEAGLLIGEPVRQPLELAGPVDMRPSTHLGQLIDVLLQLLDGDDGFFVKYPLVGVGFQRWVIGALIENTPNNYQKLLKRHYGGPARRHVTLLEEYVEAHLRDALTVGDMAQAAGVSARTLRDSARRMRNKTPELILRTMRLHAAHKRFENPLPHDTVVSVAHEYGFTNAGRFARQYQQEFRGEAPIETLQRGRRKI